ncbi:hypothetical protein [Algoriphagus mannitolivorans]|uniref:hypothetical protein n=1 Tax=Algoriphagus mannitolivorans TaxID=226504 RepID=UPI0012F7A9A2|nr:hypothetical protein [Algoriphagus mannitolivorans]
MNSIFDILDGLPYHEKSQILCFCATRNSTQSKIYLLLKEYVENPHQEDTHYSLKFYGTEPCPAFSQLKKRVKKEVLELICMLKKTTPSGEAMERIHCTESLLQSQILLARGLISPGAKQLEKSLKTAINADFPDLILSIFGTAREYGLEGIIRKKEIPELEMIVKNHLRILASQYCLKQPAGNSQKSLLSPLLRQLNKEKNTWEILAEIRYAIDKKDFEKADKLLSESEEVLKKDHLSNEIFEEFLLAKQQVLLQTSQFIRVLQNHKAIDLSKIHRKETCQELTEYQWYALFYQEKWEEALNLLKKNLSKSDPENIPKWKYWEAHIRFGQKLFKPALQLIHDGQNELKKSPDYYLGSKMLELMILFDQNEMDWLDYKVENLRKLLARWKGKINSRIESAFLVFMCLMKTNKIDLQDQLAEHTHLHKLQSCTGEYSWSPIDFELIRYDHWFSSHFQLSRLENA